MIKPVASASPLSSAVHRAAASVKSRPGVVADTSCARSQFGDSPQCRRIPDVSLPMRGRCGRRNLGFAGFSWICGLAAAIVGSPADVRAQGNPPSSTRCHFENASTGKVTAVTDGRSFLLEDGREIRLAGIEVPPPPRSGETGPRAEAGTRRPGRAPIEFLAVEMSSCATMGRRPTATAASSPMPSRKTASRRSAAHEMLAQGFARVSAAGRGCVPCAEELLARERAARQAKLGLWGESRIMSSWGRRAWRARGRAGPFHGGGRQGVVGPRERRHHLYEFRAAMVGGAHGHDLETE